MRSVRPTPCSGSTVAFPSFCAVGLLKWSRLSIGQGSSGSGDDVEDDVVVDVSTNVGHPLVGQLVAASDRIVAPELNVTLRGFKSMPEAIRSKSSSGSAATVINTPAISFPSIRNCAKSIRLGLMPWLVSAIREASVKSEASCAASTTDVVDGTPTKTMRKTLMFAASWKSSVAGMGVEELEGGLFTIWAALVDDLSTVVVVVVVVVVIEAEIGLRVGFVVAVTVDVLLLLLVDFSVPIVLDIIVLDAVLLVAVTLVDASVLVVLDNVELVAVTLSVLSGVVIADGDVSVIAVVVLVSVVVGTVVETVVETGAVETVVEVVSVAVTLVNDADVVVLVTVMVVELTVVELIEVEVDV